MDLKVCSEPIDHVDEWRLLFAKDLLQLLPAIPVKELLAIVAGYVYPSFDYILQSQKWIAGNWMKLIPRDVQGHFLSMRPLRFQWEIENDRGATWSSISREESLKVLERLRELIEPYGIFHNQRNISWMIYCMVHHDINIRVGGTALELLWSS